MLDLITEMITEMINSVLSFLENPYTTIGDLVFHADKYMAKTLGATGMESLSKYILYTGYSLIIIKFLIKGFNQYILQQEGDADAAPSGLFERFVKAIIISVSFSQIYEWGTEIGMDIITQAIDKIAGVKDANLSEVIIKTIVSQGFFLVIIALVFIIMYILLYLQLIRRGLEMLILRIGVSWACIGIIDSDEEVFKTYIKKFFQNFLTVLIQLILLKFGIALLFHSQNLWAIASMSLALGTPKFLQEFMIVSRGEGGSLNKAYYAGNMARSLFESISNKKFIGNK